MGLNRDHADEVSRGLDPVLGVGDLDDAVHHADASQERADFLGELVGHSEDQNLGGVLEVGRRPETNLEVRPGRVDHEETHHRALDGVGDLHSLGSATLSRPTCFRLR